MTEEENLKVILESINTDINYDLTGLENFIKELEKPFINDDDDDDDEDEIQIPHIIRYSKNILKDLIELKRLKECKILLETKLKSINDSIEIKDLDFYNIKRGDRYFDKLYFDLDTCWTVDILSLYLEETIFSEYVYNSTNLVCFASEQEALSYIEFSNNIKVGNRYKIINKGKTNDGTHNRSAKKFYNIDRDMEYCFDNDKIWEIKKVGYYEDKMLLPYVERSFIDDDGNSKIEWQIPRYLFGNVLFL